MIGILNFPSFSPLSSCLMLYAVVFSLSAFFLPVLALQFETIESHIYTTAIHQHRIFMQIENRRRSTKFLNSAKTSNQQKKSFGRLFKRNSELWGYVIFCGDFLSMKFVAMGD